MGLAQLRGDRDLPYASISVYESFTEAKIVIADEKSVIKIVEGARILAMDEKDYVAGDYNGENLFIGYGADHNQAARAWCEKHLQPYIEAMK